MKKEFLLDYCKSKIQDSADRDRASALISGLKEEIIDTMIENAVKKQIDKISETTGKDKERAFGGLIGITQNPALNFIFSPSFKVVGPAIIAIVLFAFNFYIEKKSLGSSLISVFAFVAVYSVFTLFKKRKR